MVPSRSSDEAFRLWAETYDAEPNPLLRLGDRVLDEALGDLAGLRILDAGCGTGRWMRKASGARVVGVDGEPAMLRPAPRGRVAAAELGAAPFRSDAFDLAVSAFCLSYLPDPFQALADLCRLVRTGGRVAIVDLAGEAAAAGWRRTFAHGGRTVKLESDVGALERALAAPPPGWTLAASRASAFGETERAAIGETRWPKVEGVPAVRVTVWRRSG